MFMFKLKNKNVKGTTMTLNILYEDNHIVVCHKAAGVATQSRKISEPDMVSLLKKHIYQNSIQKKEPYLAVIHRLDQPVEGLLVFGKTPFAAKELNSQLNRGGFGKHYQALLSSCPSKSQGTLTDYLVKNSRTNTSSVCQPDTPEAKKAILAYQIVETSKDFALANIILETGRHHQIRVQMAHLGCPILGDTKYNPQPFSSGAHRTLALCATRLTFLHPKTKKQVSFEITPAFLEHI